MTKNKCGWCGKELPEEFATCEQMTAGYPCKEQEDYGKKLEVERMMAYDELNGN